MEASLTVLNELKEQIEKGYLNFKKTPKDRITTSYTKSRLENLETQYNKFRDLHEKLINDFPPKKLKETNYMKTNAFEKVFDLFLDYKVQIQKYIPMSQTFTQPEEMDEDGQEEWLSEGLLTDDDNGAPEQDRSDSAIGDNSMETSLDNTAVSQDTSSKIHDSTIEQELTNMDNEQQNELPDELGTFLIRKPDSKPSQPTEEESDGNDTDDLLRMLEDDDKTKKKKKVKVSAKEKKDASEDSSGDDDDEFVYEGATVKRLRVAKTVLMRKKPATRAEPEVSSDETNASSDEATTVKKMFGVRKPTNIAAKSTAKPHVDTPRPKGTYQPLASVSAGKKPCVVTQVVKIAPETPPATSTPLKTYTIKGPQNNPILKSSPVNKNSPQASKPANKNSPLASKPANKNSPQASKPAIKNNPQASKPAIKNSPLASKPAIKNSPQASKPANKDSPQASKPAIKNSPQASKPAIKNSPQASKPANKSVQKVAMQVEDKVKKVVMQVEDKIKKIEKEFDEIINEEEFLDEDEFDLDEDFADESDGELDRRVLKQRRSRGRAGQPVMRPEQLDEDMYSDGDSEPDDDDSFYEDLPSSDSEDLEDWFTLDIRAERAGDYLPLLGAKAYELLLEEKQRVSTRVDELRKRLETINEANKLRSDTVRAATAALADVEDMIKAA